MEKEQTIHEAGDQAGAENVVPQIIVGQKLKIGEKVYSFVGVVDEEGPEKGKPVVKVEGEELHKVLEPAELDRGIFIHEADELLRDIGEEIPLLMKDYWEAECVNNPENNPEKVDPPAWQ